VAGTLNSALGHILPVASSELEEEEEIGKEPKIILSSILQKT
jgi:hypothetical protein